MALNVLLIEKAGLSGGIGRHSGLKIRRFVNSGRTGSIPVSGTKIVGLLFSALIELDRFEPAFPPRRTSCLPIGCALQNWLR